MTEQKYSILRRYFTEAVVLGLTVAVVTLFYMYIDMNNYIRENMSTVLGETKDALKRNNEALEKINTTIIKQSP